MSRGQKFGRLLQVLGRCSESMVYHDEIVCAVQKIIQVSEDVFYVECNCVF
jgi:hypothetical protein